MNKEDRPWYIAMRDNPNDHLVLESTGDNTVEPDPSMVVTEMTEEDKRARFEKRKREK